MDSRAHMLSIHGFLTCCVFEWCYIFLYNKYTNISLCLFTVPIGNKLTYLFCHIWVEIIDFTDKLIRTTYLSR